MRSLLFRLYVLWGFVAVATSVTKAAKRKVAGRRSRQVHDVDPAEGVWSVWGEWSECSQPCGVGVSQRSRTCLAPPPSPPRTPPLSYSPPNWGGYLQRGFGGPVVSPVRPFYPQSYPPYRSPHSPPTGHNAGLPLYRNTNSGGGVGGGGGGAPLPGAPIPSPPFRQPEFPSANHERAPVPRHPYSSSSHGYSQPTRIIRRPTSRLAARAGGGGSRRSVSTNREGSSSRRSSSIRPGQFGYGKMPFSLPLHRPNRQARHTDNTTQSVTPSPRPAEEGVEAASEGVDRAAEITDAPAAAAASAAEQPPATTTGNPPRHFNRPLPQTVLRAPPPHTLGRSSPPSSAGGRHRFDWHSVTAPPPPVPPLSRPNGVAPPFSTSLHRPGPLHPDREHRPAFAPPVPAAGNLYPLQYPHLQHQGPELGRDGGQGSSQVYRCSGPEKEHRRCFTQVCGGGAPESRAEQCTAFNAQEFMGRLYNWEPFTEVGADKQCELTCRPAGYRFYVRLAEMVRDGTSCVNVSSNDVCVEGKCLTEGCDGVLGSGSTVDRCGVCGGRDSSCRKVTGSFRNVTVPLGYHKILDIPAGATFINVTERRASPNYLAMRSGTGASVVNGRWAVDPPGEYKAGGTTFTYTRPRAQAEGVEERGETLRAAGPTSTQLQLYIIFHKENPGIDYEFYVPVEKKDAERERERERERPVEVEWETGRHPPRERSRERESGSRASLRSPLTLSVEDPPPAPPPMVVPSFSSSSSSSSVFSPPTSDLWIPDRSRPRASAPNRNARIPPRTDLPLDTLSPFVWRRGAFTECSATCGKGSQHRVILCIDRFADEEVPESKCDSAAKPVPEEEPCNTHPCPPFWEASSWSECSVSCGPGLQQRQLQCRQSFGNRSTMVHPQRCANLTSPESTQACQLGLCSHWEVSSDWSQCSVDCGLGRRTRNVRCVTDQGSIVNDQECSTRVRPQGSEECNMGPCVTNWYFTDWSKACSAQCGPGVQKREVVCLTRGGIREGEGGGDCVGDKPAEMKACNGGPCMPRSMWYSSPWTQCNVPCGNGTQRRDIICVQKNGNDFSVAPASKCAHLDKPAAVQACEMDECRPQWFTTEWSACSRSCGKGLQMREVRCLTEDKRHSQDCDAGAKPAQEQLCNVIPCGPQVSDENCRDRHHNCVMVVQARLCVYSYYKNACCASCTHSAQRAKRH